MKKPEKLQIMRVVWEGLKQINGADMTTNKKATSAVFSKLCEVAHSFNYLAGARGRPACCDWGEWLYDAVWYKYNNDQHDHLVEVPLVAESEWSHDFTSVRDDFHKLLLARAGIRLMVYQYQACIGDIHVTEHEYRFRREKAARNIAERLTDSINAFEYRDDDDAWLLVGGVWLADNDWGRAFTIEDGKVVQFGTSR